MLTNDFFENIPDHGLLAFDQLLGCLDGGSQAHHYKTVEDEGLEQFERHQLGQTALMQLEMRADHNNRTTGVVNALAQLLLTEAIVLTLYHVGHIVEHTL